MFGKLVELDRSNYPIDTGPGFKHVSIHALDLSFRKVFSFCEICSIQVPFHGCFQHPEALSKGPTCRMMVLSFPMPTPYCML